MLRLFVLLLLAPAAAAAGAESAPALRRPDWSSLAIPLSAPDLSARAAILVDAGSRTVLYERNPHLVVPPASLTKVVAIDVALRAARLGLFDLDEPFAPPEAGWAQNQPAGSSLMFLGPGQEVTLREILVGLAVSSGNDAAVTLALRTAGSVPGFASRMNATVRSLGLVDLTFEEPSGLSPANSITADGFARFMLAHLEAFPEAPATLYSRREYTYPQISNRTTDGRWPAISQQNRNGLLWSYDGADGMKTGFIDESGYNLAATAERDGRRLVAVVLGVQASGHAAGARLREADAAALLDYGFSAFETITFDPPAPQPIRVYGGADPVATPPAVPALTVSIPVGSRGLLVGSGDQVDALLQPNRTPVEVGRYEVRVGDVEVGSIPIALPAQRDGGVLRRVWDAIARWIATLRGRPPADPALLRPA